MTDATLSFGFSIVPALTFYLFSLIVLLSALRVITTRNPVHAVLFLILAFVSAGGLFVLLGAEFLAMILIIVYVGAVAVLFLFVVMMLDVNFERLREGRRAYAWLGFLVGCILLAELLLALISRGKLKADKLAAVAHISPPSDTVPNTEALGLLLYTHYAYLFQMAGLILLVAMIGAIVLTLRVRPGVRRQKVREQISRRWEDAVTLENPEPGQGA